MRFQCEMTRGIDEAGNPTLLYQMNLLRLGAKVTAALQERQRLIVGVVGRHYGQR